MKGKVTVKILLDTRRKKVSGRYPVKLRITYQREQKYYPTEYDLTPDDFDRVFGAKPRTEQKEIRANLVALETKANTIAEKLPVFSFTQFEALFFSQSGSRDAHDVAHTFDAVIERLMAEERIGTAENYKYSKLSICEGHPRLKFADVTPDFLRDYQKQMERGGSSRTTIGIYLRCLRALFNEAIETGTILKESYPFGKRKYQIPASQNIKKALTISDIQKIQFYQPETESEAKARDLWMFSYLCNGMNLKDIAQLRFKNIDEKAGIVTFHRAKTENTSRKLKPVKAVLLDPAKAIIERWGNSDKRPESFVFPILTNDMNAERQMASKNLQVKLINKYMKRIGRKLGIDMPLTTYVARHSFATILKRSGAPTEFISESLGHKDLRTTETYLDGFENATKQHFAKALLNFGEPETE